MSEIVIRNMARVEVPDELKADILRMFTYYKRGQQEPVKSYKYRNGIAYLPLNLEKIKVVADMLGATIRDERGFRNVPPRQFQMNPGFEFRDYQVEPAASLLSYIQTNKYGTFSAPCGTGKTLMLTYVSGSLGEKTLILVDQSNLMDNWIESNKILWNRDTQIITSKTKELEHVGICTFQLLNKNEDLLYRVREEYGCLLIDEAHTVTAKTYMKVMSHMNNRYRVATSATFFNKNLPLELLVDSCGSPVCVEMVDENALIPKVTFVNTGIDIPSESPDDFTSKTLPFLSENDKRNQMILDIVRQGHLDGRHMIVICIKQDMANYLADKSQEFCNAVSYVGTTSRKKDKDIKDGVESGEIDVVYTCKKMDKGTDFAIADMLVNARPGNNKGTTQQISGRVVRKWNGKPIPEIIDLVDRGRLSWRFAANRHAWYAEFGYTFNEKSYFFLDIF